MYLFTGNEPPVLLERAFEAALIAAAEHEFNPSTFAARLAGSTGRCLCRDLGGPLCPIGRSGRGRG